MSNYLAIDLGAESGHVILGSLEGDRLALDELHRFPNQPVRLPNGLYWDALRLHHEMVEGLTVAGRQRKLSISGIGVDTWGVDFGLLARDGGLIDCPRHYRDERNIGVSERLFTAVPRAEVFGYTGIQIMDINSLVQLYAMKLTDAPALSAAERLLFMPDLFAYWLTGVERAEVTIASTSQFYDPQTRRFSAELFHRLGLPAKILPELIEPGTKLGSLLPRLAESTGLGPVPFYATAGHDTAAAVAAVPPGRRLVLHQLRHLVVDGSRTAAPRDQPTICRAQLHQRSGRSGTDATAEEHRRPMGAAGVPAGLGGAG